MTTFKTLLKQARLPEKTVTVCLRGDLAVDYDLALRAYESAQQRAGESLAGADLGEALDRLEAIEAEMQEHSYDFKLRALPKSKFRALVSGHAPRRITNADGEEHIHPSDVFVGVNSETFFDALVRACLVDPELDDDDWAELDEKLNDKQYSNLADMAWTLNRSDVDPFSRAASRNNQSSANA